MPPDDKRGQLKDFWGGSGPSEILITCCIARKRDLMRTITLKFSGRCYQCGTRLPVGTIAKRYGRGRIYGRTCHTRTTRRPVSTPVPGVAARPVATTPFTQLVHTAQKMTVSSYMFDLSVRSYIGSRLGLKSGLLGQVTSGQAAEFRSAVRRLGPEKAMGVLTEIEHQLNKLVVTGPWDCGATLRDVASARRWVHLRYFQSHRSRPVRVWSPVVNRML
jgi:hypothetical protein